MLAEDSYGNKHPIFVNHFEVLDGYAAQCDAFQSALEQGACHLLKVCAHEERELRSIQIDADGHSFADCDGTLENLLSPSLCAL